MISYVLRPPSVQYSPLQYKLTGCADVTRGVGRPGDPVDARPVIVEPRHGRARHPDVEDDDLAGVHGDGREVVGVLLVPGEAEERRVAGVLVDDGGVLEVPQVEHAHGAVGADRGEHVPAAAGLGEGDVVDLLVVRDQLRLDVARDGVDAPEHLARLQPPDGARRVDGGGPEQVGVDLVPVEGGERRAEVGVLVIVEETLQPRLGLARPSHTQVVAGGGKL